MKRIWVTGMLGAGKTTLANIAILGISDDKSTQYKGFKNEPKI